MNNISVVIPLYKCSSSLIELNERLNNTLKGITEEYEIIYVVDGSPENEWEIVVKIAQNNHRVKGIEFTRNFGQHNAISAGLDILSGDIAVVLDGDLQDKPEDIPFLYKELITKEADVVFGRRIQRKDSLWKKITSRLFYKLFNFLSGLDFNYQVANFSIISRKVVDSYRRMNEYTKAYPMFIKWLGYEIHYSDLQHSEREFGTSSYSLIKLIKLGGSIIISNSNKPLRIGIHIGIIISTFSFFVGLFYMVKYFITGIPVVGWTSLIVSLWFISGIIISFLGLIGVYIGKIFDETKSRPPYVILNRTINLD